MDDAQDWNGGEKTVSVNGTATTVTAGESTATHNSAAP